MKCKLDYYRYTQSVYSYVYRIYIYVQYTLYHLYNILEDAIKHHLKNARDKNIYDKNSCFK